MTLRVGVDLGGTNIRAALLDEKGTILREVREKTEAHLGPVRIIAKLISVVERVKGEEKVRGIGIGCPGPLAWMRKRASSFLLPIFRDGT
ncbi:ROK family protein [Rossellomorea aquimaris]|uniref:ROK family protein n=1 Tax=Rossellomorea aquimaris TaxID=189382 RepID=UPI0021CCC73D|nr:ROK family protein [Rossellomorea aquimaris]